MKYVVTKMFYMKQFWILIKLVFFVGYCSIAQPPNTGKFKVLHDKPQQIIWGLGVEIQNDAIGSNNRGLPNDVVAIPDNLLPTERKRFYNSMLKGFRYCRLAMGLYFRGLDSAKQQIVERYPGQLAGLKELIGKSGMEGICMEYWSPAPYWKSTNSYIGGTLKSYDTTFLHQLGKALSKDLQYLQQNNIKVSMWGLQNEALLQKELPYSHCIYTPENYLKTFKTVAPYIRSIAAGVTILADSWEAPINKAGELIKADSAAFKNVDAWAMHRIGIDADLVIKESDEIKLKAATKPVLTNEFEYLVEQGAYASDERCLNTAQTIMNWLVFANSPSWFWLHALKPTYNAEASGFALGFWRPMDDNDYSKFKDIKKGHWKYNDKNFNAIAGFLKYMPWNSKRFEVKEDYIRGNNRILAFKTPAEKLVLVLTNRNKEAFTFNIDVGSRKVFKGFRYTPYKRNEFVKVLKGAVISPKVASLSIEYWVEQ
jgi:O-glycosyl hydrolase